MRRLFKKWHPDETDNTPVTDLILAACVGMSSGTNCGARQKAEDDPWLDGDSESEPAALDQDQESSPATARRKSKSCGAGRAVAIGSVSQSGRIFLAEEDDVAGANRSTTIGSKKAESFRHTYIHTYIQQNMHKKRFCMARVAASVGEALG